MSPALRGGLALVSSIALAAPLACADDERLAPVCERTPCPFAGQQAPIQVRRDDEGMLHVHAQTDADAFFGSGYMQAHERLFQMDLVRRRALGRAAETFGADRLGDDQLVRVVDIPRWGREGAALTEEEQPAMHDLALAWTAGVNRHVHEILRGERPLPPGYQEMGMQPEPWDFGDAYAVGKLLLFGNANLIAHEALSTALVKLHPEALERIPLLAPLHQAPATPVASPALDPEVWSRVPHLAGSAEEPSALGMTAFIDTMSRFHPGSGNAWAVDGAHTDTGLPMIAGDPHHALSSPSVLWAHHLNSADAGGSLDVVGWSFVGTPGVQLGHNRHVAWTATTTYPDTMDLVDVLRLDDATVQLAGVAIALTVREERIVVRDVGEVALRVLEVPGHGVLLPPELLPLPLVAADHDVLLRWTGLQPTRDMASFFALDVATSLDEVERAVDGMELGCFDFLSISAQGISYRSSSRVPDRGDPSTSPPAYLLLDGADPAAAWTGAHLPPSRLPHARGSTSGFLVTANTDPFGFTRDGAIAGDPWYFGVYFDPGTRARRIGERVRQAVDAHGGMTIDEMKAIQGDVRSLLAAEVIPVVDEVWREPATSEEATSIRARADVARVVDLLHDWEGDLTREHVAPVAFTGLSWFLAERAVRDELGVLLDAVAAQEPVHVLKLALLALRHPEQGALEEGRQLTVLRALASTADWLVSRFGAVERTPAWGEVHGARFESIAGPSLDGGLLPLGGGDDTIAFAPAPFLGEGNGIDGSFEARSGPVFRMVAAIGADGVPRAEHNLARGLSGHPATPHWADRQSDWQEGSYSPLLFLDAEIEDRTIERITLEP